VQLCRQQRHAPGYLGIIRSGKLSISKISLLAAVLLNPRLQIPAVLDNDLKIIAIGIVQKKVKSDISREREIEEPSLGVSS
jgi:hypothetical protein